MMTDGIIIKPENKARLEEMITAGQKKARVRCIGYVSLEIACDVIERHLGIPKKAMIGIRAYVNPCAQSFPGAYKGIPESTQFVMERTSTGWKLIDVYRARCKNREFTLVLTEMAKEAVLNMAAYF